jgi:hypothetical protein
MSAAKDPEQSHGASEDGVFRLVRLRGVNGHLSGGKHGSPNHFSGRIERLNYTLHGEINGGTLDSGDFLHLKPEGARAVDLKVGIQVGGQGGTKPMVGAHSVIEAEDVNGMVIRRHKAKKKHAAKHAQH